MGFLLLFPTQTITRKEESVGKMLYNKKKKSINIAGYRKQVMIKFYSMQIISKQIY